MNILDRIDALRKSRNWSKYELAQRADLSQTTLSNLYNRAYQPSVATIESLCRGFGITMSEFFNEDFSIEYVTEEYRQIKKHWDNMTPEQRATIINLLNLFNKR